MNTNSSTATLIEYYRWHAAIYDSTRWSFLFGRTRLIDAAAKRVRPRRILEVGCGTGKNLVRMAQVFPKAEVLGMDLSGEMLGRARRKTARFGSRIRLLQCACDRATSFTDDPFDLIVLSYCLSMINPGYAEVLQICEKHLSASGCLAVVDFHDTPFRWFRRWMEVNHVRLDGQILEALRRSSLRIDSCDLRPAYRGCWRVLMCLASK